MIALEISDIKECMAHLLLKETFDSFQFISGSITTFATFQIDGRLHKEFFDTEQLNTLPDDQNYALWRDIREYCFSLIRGKKTPLDFKFVFCLSCENTAKLLAREVPVLTPKDVQGLYLNFRYDGSALHCITGTSLNVFSLDKSLEHVWDHTAGVFFRKHGITATAAD